ncbi:MAG: CHAD domain-containing protein [Geminicoccaceae bacterium]|nr:CHAD domain-containing protein [Geminicoccaceae bacterium]
MLGTDDDEAGTAMPVECELKLVADQDELARLLGSSAVAERASRPPRLERLESVYFDTEDRRLARRNLALRVRHVDGRFIQTLKRGDGPVRGEWETTLDSDQPLPGPLFMMAGEDDLVTLDVRSLRPVLASHIDRRLQEIRLNGEDREHRVELALDLGELEAGGQRETVVELELELLEGEPAALYDLALELGRTAPIRLETLSKAARGEMLRTGAAPTWQKARRVDLKGCRTVDDAMAVVFDACYGHWLANQAAAIDGRDSEGVHQLRVAIRRLRSVFALFKDALPAERLAAHKQEAKAVLGCLGHARDLDVIAEDLVGPIRRRYPDDRAIETLAVRLDQARRTAYQDQVRPGLFAISYTLFTLEFGGWIARHGWRPSDDPELLAQQARPIDEFAHAVLEQRFTTVRKRGRRFQRLDPAGRHELRIAIKKLRYALDVLRSLFPAKPVKTMLKTLSELQDHLGAANDLAVAKGRLEVIGRSTRGVEARKLAGATGFVLGWHAAGEREAERELRALWRTFKNERPAWQSD